jgi:hypothetical protein
MLPLALPGAVGEKVAVNEILWLPLSVAGTDKPLILNPFPETTA